MLGRNIFKVFTVHICAFFGFQALDESGVVVFDVSFCVVISTKWGSWDLGRLIHLCLLVNLCCWRSVLIIHGRRLHSFFFLFLLSFLFWFVTHHEISTRLYSRHGCFYFFIIFWSCWPNKFGEASWLILFNSTIDLRGVIVAVNLSLLFP
mgnify:CR=1 FL=1